MHWTLLDDKNFQYDDIIVRKDQFYVITRIIMTIISIQVDQGCKSGLRRSISEFISWMKSGEIGLM